MSQELAISKENLPTLPDGNGLGFEALEPSDLVAPRIGIVQPTSKTELDIGQWYDANTDEAKGKELLFFVLSKRATHFMGTDFETKEETRVEKKEMLVMPEVLDYPQVISLSLTGYWPLSNLMTQLFKTYGKGGYPMFTGLIKATLELQNNDKGKYYIPKFEFVRHATQQEMDTLLIAYNDVVPLFLQGGDKEESKPESKVEQIDFSETKKVPAAETAPADIDPKDPKSRALGIGQDNATAKKKDDKFPDIKV